MTEMLEPIATKPARDGSAVRAIDASHGLIGRLRRPVAKDAYRAEIDGLRFIAIAIVVVGHFMERAARFFPEVGDNLKRHWLGELMLRPGIGVYLFFSISGFVIARQVLKARAAPLQGAFLKVYFGRRILRIEPPYIVLLLATWALIVITGYAPEQTNHFDATPSSLWASCAASIVYWHDLVWGTFPRLFPPGWSLEVEVQFYLLAPLLLWVVLRAGRGHAALLVATIGLIGGSFVSIVAPAQIGPLHTSFSLLQFFHFFWLGIVLAHAYDWIGERANRLPPLFAGCLGWAGLAAYFAMPAAPLDHIAIAMIIRAATLAALFAMFVSAFSERSSFRRFCQRPTIALIGGACYSIYLTHLQVIQLMTSVAHKLAPHQSLAQILVLLVIESLVVVLVGMAFYVAIERTFMIKDWPARFWTSLKRSVAPAATAANPLSRRL